MINKITLFSIAVLAFGIQIKLTVNGTMSMILIFLSLTVLTLAYFIQTIKLLLKKNWDLLSISLFLTLGILTTIFKLTFIYHNSIFMGTTILVLILLILIHWKRIENKFFKINVLVISFIVSCFFLSSDIFAARLLAYENKIDDITWLCFKPIEEDSTKYSALLHSGIGFKVNRAFNKLPAVAFSQIDPGKSYYQMQTDDLLKHEKYHFKITQIMTKLLNKELASMEYATPDQSMLIIEKYYSKFLLMQEDYDKQTDHCRFIEQQSKWEKRIDSLLQTLE